MAKTEEPLSTGASRLAPGTDRLADLPWWMFAAIGLGLYIIYFITTNDDATGAFWFLVGTKPDDVRELGLGGIAFQGIAVTIFVCFIAYLLAIMIGITVGLGRVSQNRIIYNLATFYVEIVRGIPMLSLIHI